MAGGRRKRGGWERGARSRPNRNQMPPRQPHTHSTAVRAAPPPARAAPRAPRGCRPVAWRPPPPSPLPRTPPGLPTPATRTGKTHPRPTTHRSRRVTDAVRHDQSRREAAQRQAGRSAPRNGSGPARVGRPPTGVTTPPTDGRRHGASAASRDGGGEGGPNGRRRGHSGHAGDGGASVCGAARPRGASPPPAPRQTAGFRVPRRQRRQAAVGGGAGGVLGRQPLLRTARGRGHVATTSGTDVDSGWAASVGGGQAPRPRRAPH